STARLTASVMKGVRHAAPIEPIRAHARAVLAAEQIAAASTWHGTTQAGAEATSHRRFEGDLNRAQRNSEDRRALDERLQHRRRAASETLISPTPSKKVGDWPP